MLTTRQSWASGTPLIPATSLVDTAISRGMQAKTWNSQTHCRQARNWVCGEGILALLKLKLFHGIGVISGNEWVHVEVLTKLPTMGSKLRLGMVGLPRDSAWKDLWKHVEKEIGWGWGLDERKEPRIEENRLVGWLALIFWPHGR